MKFLHLFQIICDKYIAFKVTLTFEAVLLRHILLPHFIDIHGFRCLSTLQTATIPLFESDSPRNISLDTIMAINLLLFTSYQMDGDWLVLVYQGRIEAEFLSNLMNGRPQSSLNLFHNLSSFPIHNSDKRKSLSAFNSSYGFRGLYTSL